MTVAAQLNAICDAQPFVTRFMVRNLLTGEEIGREKTRRRRRAAPARRRS